MIGLYSNKLLFTGLIVCLVALVAAVIIKSAIGVFALVGSFFGASVVEHQRQAELEKMEKKQEEEINKMEKSQTVIMEEELKLVHDADKKQLLKMLDEELFK